MRRPTSIRSQLLAIVMVTTGVALACALAGVLLGTIWSFHRNNIEDMSTQADLVGRMTSPALAFDDTALASSNLALFAARPRIRVAAIYDENGRLFASYRPADVSTAVPVSPAAEGARLVGADIVVFRPILQDGAVVGTVHLRSRSDLSAMLRRALLIAAVASAVALVLAYLLVRRLGRIVIRPIAAVAGVAREVVEQRDYSRRVERAGGDEVGELVDSFNAMLAEVEARTAQLRTAFERTVRESAERQAAQREVQRLNEDLERRVTERTLALEQTNRELSAAREAAVEANRAKSNFLATMSHEIRTPMNGVIGMIEVLHQSSLRADQLEMANLIRDSAFSLLGIIEDILDFSRIEAGRMEIEAAPLALAPVVESACAMLDNIALRNEVELTLFVDPAIPDPLVGDTLRLRQVVVNLVSNAIKFSAGTGRRARVRVEVACEALDAERVWIRLTVADNGIGIEPAVQARLFSAFSQADNSTTRRFGGSGLGLTISRELAGLMGGTLDVASEPGAGATFSLRLPLMLAAGPPLVPAEPDIAAVPCLVVAGDEGIGADVAAYLHAAGAAVERAADLTTAARRLVSDPRTWIVVLDTAGDLDQLERANSADPDLAGLAGRLVVLGRGIRRIPRWRGTRVVELDGNVMARRHLLAAVAMAAGRIQEDPEARPTPSGPTPARRSAPTRAQALQADRLVLVAEDNGFNRQVIVRQLGLLGYAADVADNGREALAAYLRTGHALLLTDIHMPELDGYQLAAAIRAGEGGGHRLPILALTANALQGEEARCRAAGMDGYIAKPVLLSELRSALQRWVPIPDDPLVAPSAAPEPQPPPHPESLPVDVHVLEQFVGDDADATARFLAQFLASAERIGGDIERAWEAGDLQQAGEHAHSLKSSASMVGAKALGATCKRLEAAGFAGERTEFGSLLRRFRGELQSVRDFLADRAATPD